MAFNYTKIFTNYHNITDHSECVTDMIALTKASCHPNDKWFTGSDYDISLSPKQRQNVTNRTLTQDNTIVLCSLFCSEIWDHCSDLQLRGTPNLVCILFSLLQSYSIHFYFFKFMNCLICFMFDASCSRLQVMFTVMPMIFVIVNWQW